MSNKIIVILVVMFCFASCKKSAPAEEITEKMSYADSLSLYFSSFEQKLINQYRVNHENLVTDEDFYNFYRNAYTLTHSLTNTLKRYVLQQRQDGKVEALKPINWFEKVAKGLEVAIVYQGAAYAVFFDYQDLHDHAEQTTGTRDDDFVRLLEYCYNPHSYLTKWEILKSDFLGCNTVGRGFYKNIFTAIDSVLEKDSLFHKQIANLQSHLLRDLAYKPYYCYSKAEVLAELNFVLRNAKFLSAKNRANLEQIIAKIKAEELENLQFDCETKACDYPY